MPRPKDKNVIRTKWIFINKLNGDGQVVGNIAILVYKGYSQVEGIDFEENVTSISRIESIRMFLPFAFFR